MDTEYAQEGLDSGFDIYEKKFTRQSWLSKFRLLIFGVFAVSVAGSVMYFTFQELGKGTTSLVAGALESPEALEGQVMEKGEVEAATAE